MAGTFRPGQLVGLNELTDPSMSLPLHSVPGGTVDVRTIGRMTAQDVALVIGVTAGCASVYVVGPNGSGWTFGAMLKLVR